MVVTEYQTFVLVRAGGVATITLAPPAGKPVTTANLHWELATALSELRVDNEVRVIVITGAGDQFLVVRPPESYRSDAERRARTEPRYLWETFTGIAVMHEQMAQMEKPIIAKVNGDAIGFGSTLVFACDLIVAREDATIVDTHMAMGEYPNVGPAEFGLVPGDGGTALIPLFMSPALAKEYLMLGRPFTAAELARLGSINYAVSAAELDACVDQLVARLLDRSAYALAWTKRAANKLVIDQLNRGLDAGLGYEMVNFLEWERMGWRDTKSLLDRDKT
jgi:enoyl-CoA hydratase/carnithine racemase